MGCHSGGWRRFTPPALDPPRFRRRPSETVLSARRQQFFAGADATPGGTSIGREQILVPLTKKHAEFYLGEPGIRPSQRIVQPSNKGTAPPILYALLSIEQSDPEAIVAILPCDHHYSDDRAFTSVLESAFELASANTDRVVLLGAIPHGPETEYGWIGLGAAAGGDPEIAAFHVRDFCEKPSSHLATQLFERDSLWNTFVMVGHVRGFLEMVRAARPGVLDTFNGHRLWNGTEAYIPELAL